ncbi:anthrax toxin lethal factor-related metalloendopeptidase [Niallia sp. Krafla_26]|uniref:anthrax toxin lethal factor-related metalloendopeptidase n=1 Tax=Niallia sp. Krafla_26 TaxID=3064703 RepID=UPI003D175069
MSLVLLGNSQAEKDGIKLAHFPTHSSLKQLPLHSIEALNHIIVLPKSNFNEIEAGKIILRIDQLPQSLLDKVRENGIVIKLFTGKLTENSTARHLAGTVPRGYEQNITWDDIPGVGGGKTVLVRIGASMKGNGHSSVNLELHELAHSIDRHVFGEIRNQESFLTIWDLEKEKLFPYQKYFLMYPEEYFAEAFAYFYCSDYYRDILKKYAPLTFDYIQHLK